MKVKHVTVPFKFKAIDEKAGTFEGYASVFNVVDRQRDIVLPGAFKETLKQHAANETMPKMLWQHQSAEPIGIWESMKEDKKGLFAEGRLLINDNVPTADKAHTLLKAGAVDGLSIGFRVPKGGETFDEEQNAFILSEIDLVETSVVTFPANVDALINEVRSQCMAELSEKQIEGVLRDAGFSRSQTRALLSGGYAAFTQCDAAAKGEDSLDRAQVNKVIGILRG